MDKIERKKPQQDRQYAGQPEIAERDRPLMDSPAGRDNDKGMTERGRIANQDVLRKDVGARPRSEITGQHDDGLGANETVDGLDPNGEMVRHAAEDIGTGDGFEDRREKPVFDRD